MKKQATFKKIKSITNWQIAIGYCQMQSLLKFATPKYYLSSVTGWDADVYLIDGGAIITGYRPKGLQADYKLVQSYEEKATGETDFFKLEELTKELIQKVLEK